MKIILNLAVPFGAALFSLTSMPSVASAAEEAAACFDENSAIYFPKNDWRYCQQIEPNLFMYYTALPEEEDEKEQGGSGNVMLGFHATSGASGWTALALAGNGGMKGASQIVVRQNDEGGEWVAEDRYSIDYTTPIMDESQDVKLLFADQIEEKGETAWGVLLMINPCDEPFDYPIENKSMYMHWALGADHTFSFHGKQRGQFKANLFQAPKVSPNTEGLETIDFLMPNVPVVLGEDGTDPTNPYICAFFDLEVLWQDKTTERNIEDKTHVIRWTPQLSEASKQYVHHMILYSCASGGGDDDDDGLPVDFSNVEHHQLTTNCEIMPRGCYEMKYGWAVGGSDIVMPDDVGMPIGEGKRWLALQMHYYNPDLEEGIFDSSGVRGYISPEVRPQDAGIIEFDAGTSSYQRPSIPMGLSNFELPPYVITSDCTTNWWKSPLNILGVFHHMHRYGTRMSIDLMRDGEDYGPLRKEFGYDFNHQSTEESVVEQLLPGDQLTIKCTYDTSRASQNTSFGDLTQQEMCYGGVLYYPRVQNQYFYYYPPAATPEICSSPGTGEQWSNVSRCAQVFSESVPTFFDYAEESPIDFDAVTMCNADWYENEVGWIFQDICPSCHETKTCTAEEVARHAQEDFCVRWCMENANLSLYPDLSQTEAYDTGSWGCPRELYTAPYQPQPPTCKKIGNLTLGVPENAAGVRLDDDEEEFLGHAASSGTSSFHAATISTTIASLLVVLRFI